MELVLQREILTDKSTIGRLFVNDEFACFCLEDTLRPDGEKVAGKTCIPAGHYRVVIDMSARFGRLMPHILDVPGFTGIRIHSGNTPENTDGCPLVGLTKGTDFIGESRLAFEKFFPMLQAALQDGQECHIEIRNP